MKTYFCSQQERVAAAIQAGQWPEACGPELRAHVESCQSCADVVLVSQALLQSRRAALQAAQLPSPGVLWWRAQVLRRNAALERMIRPVAVAEKLAVAIITVALIAFVGWQREQVTGWLSNVWGPLSNITLLPGLLMVAAGTLAILGAVAVYLLNAKE